jgi:hypothetical protein
MIESVVLQLQSHTAAELLGDETLGEELLSPLVLSDSDGSDSDGSDDNCVSVTFKYFIEEGCSRGCAGFAQLGVDGVDVLSFESEHAEDGTTFAHYPIDVTYEQIQDAHVPAEDRADWCSQPQQMPAHMRDEVWRSIKKNITYIVYGVRLQTPYRILWKGAGSLNGKNVESADWILDFDDQHECQTTFNFLVDADRSQRPSTGKRLPSQVPVRTPTESPGNGPATSRLKGSDDCADVVAKLFPDDQSASVDMVAESATATSQDAASALHVSVASNNADPTCAIAGDTITITVRSLQPMQDVTIVVMGLLNGGLQTCEAMQQPLYPEPDTCAIELSEDRRTATGSVVISECDSVVSVGRNIDVHATLESDGERAPGLDATATSDDSWVLVSNAPTCGLSNSGSTCFMSVVVQDLFQDVEFKTALMLTDMSNPALASTPSHTCDAAVVLYCLQQLFHGMDNAVRQIRKGPLDMAPLMNLLHHSFQHGSKQEDAPESRDALLHILDSAASCELVDTAHMHGRSFSQLVHLDMRYDLYCPSCDGWMQPRESYVCMELVIRELAAHGSLNDALIQLFDAGEDVANKCCPCCDDHTLLKQRLKFGTTPARLRIMLARHKATATHGAYQKDCSTFSFEAKLQLNAKWFVSAMEPQDYDLTSIIVHKGTMHSGHYTVFIRDSRDTCSDNPAMWKCDDQNTPVLCPWDEVQRAAVGAMVPSAAYELTYTVRDTLYTAQLQKEDMNSSRGAWFWSKLNKALRCVDVTVQCSIETQGCRIWKRTVVQQHHVWAGTTFAQIKTLCCRQLSITIDWCGLSLCQEEVTTAIAADDMGATLHSLDDDIVLMTMQCVTPPLSVNPANDKPDPDDGNDGPLNPANSEPDRDDGNDGSRATCDKHQCDRAIECQTQPCGCHYCLDCSIETFVGHEARATSGVADSTSPMKGAICAICNAPVKSIESHNARAAHPIAPEAPVDVTHVNDASPTDRGDAGAADDGAVLSEANSAPLRFAGAASATLSNQSVADAVHGSGKRLSDQQKQALQEAFGTPGCSPALDSNTAQSSVLCILPEFQTMAAVVISIIDDGSLIEFLKGNMFTKSKSLGTLLWDDLFNRALKLAGFSHHALSDAQTTHLASLLMPTRETFDCAKLSCTAVRGSVGNVFMTCLEYRQGLCAAIGCNASLRNREFMKGPAKSLAHRHRSKQDRNDGASPTDRAHTSGEGPKRCIKTYTVHCDQNGVLKSPKQLAQLLDEIVRWSSLCGNGRSLHECHGRYDADLHPNIQVEQKHADTPELIAPIQRVIDSLNRNEAKYKAFGLTVPKLQWALEDAVVQKKRRPLQTNMGTKTTKNTQPSCTSPEEESEGESEEESEEESVEESKEETEELESQRSRRARR